MDTEPKSATSHHDSLSQFQSFNFNYAAVL